MQVLAVPRGWAVGRQVLRAQVVTLPVQEVLVPGPQVPGGSVLLLLLQAAHLTALQDTSLMARLPQALLSLMLSVVVLALVVVLVQVLLALLAEQLQAPTQLQVVVP